MTTLQAFILGIIQGITEFLPISSSGHLHLAQHLLGLKQLDRYMLFDLACHLGTLLAIVWVFFADIKNLFGSNKKRLTQLAIGILPLFPLVLIMKPIKAMYADPTYLGFFFILTSIILFIGIRFGQEAPLEKRTERTWRDAFAIGLWQAVAILPGVSRSGSTITGARLLGWSTADAIAFSFLLAIPAVLGGTVLELWALWKNPALAGDVSFSTYATGFTISLVTGLAALKLLIYLSSKNKFFYFAWYCLILGLATTYYFHLYRG